MRRKISCIMPSCTNNNYIAPYKIFFCAPKNTQQLEMWKKVIGGEIPAIKIFVCEDHFDIKNDMICYEVYNKFGGIPNLKLDAVPQKDACPPTEVAPSKSEAELDKFKRRLIRAVARLLVQEKKPEEEVWASLKKETNCDCKLLWSRMRALTLKKLTRMFAAEDRVDAIPKGARMSVTDWLLFDLVLVHQDMDLIGMGHPLTDRKPLQLLFDLVKKFQIEGKSGDNLALSWSAGTLWYNNQGHQCSPMLLQKRWYQLKLATREQFYKFWYAYRGAAKRLSLAEPDMPTPLQADIARRFKPLVTSAFMEWEEMIEKGYVTLPEVFENKITDDVRRAINSNLTADVEVIEPVIETIDLGVDSENESEEDKRGEAEPSIPTEMEVKIKEEPPDDIDIDGPHIEPPSKKSIYEEVLEFTDVEHDKIDAIDYPESNDELAEEENEITEAIEHTLRNRQSMLPQITNVFGNVDENVNLSEINALNANIKSAGHDVIRPANELDKLVPATPVADVSPATDVTPATDATLATDATPATDVPPATDATPVFGTEMNLVLDASKRDEQENTPDTAPNESMEIDTAELENAEGNEMQDTHTTTDEIDIDTKLDVTELSNLDTISSQIDLTVQDEKPDIKFSFGEFSNDMNFADDGIEFVDDGIAYQDEYDDTSNSIKTEGELEGVKPPVVDKKLLMCPIIYTTRLDDMGLFKTQSFKHVNDKQLIEVISTRSKPVKVIPEEAEESESEDNEDVVPDAQKVKVSSHLLQKPRSRTYNTIQLCKNPDFNTRLKRLTVGFYTSPRNLGLLKTCKPLTIDLSKTFESKLVGGTLYLKGDVCNIKQETVEDTCSRQSVSVIPSAMPVQSLIDNSKAVEIFPVVSNYSVCPKPPDDGFSTVERNKIINLPDISEIRRINQRLLTAEVSPIQIQNNMPQVPVSIVTTSHTNTNPIPKNIVMGESVKEVYPQKTIHGPPSVVDMTKDSAEEDITACRIGRQPKLISVRRLWPAKPVSMPWKPKQFKPAIPWLTKSIEVTTVNHSRKAEQALLTLDTLNKMLYLLTNKEEPKASSVPKLPKSKRRNMNKQRRDSQSTQAADDNDVQIVIDEKSSKQSKKCAKPKFNIKSALNPPNKKAPANNARKGTVRDTKKSSESAEHSKDQDVSENDRRFCCWAQRRMASMVMTKIRLPPHDCPYPLCNCCCRNLLMQYSVNERRLNQATMKRNIRTEEVATQCDDQTLELDKKSEKSRDDAEAVMVTESAVETSSDIPTVTGINNPDENVSDNDKTPIIVDVKSCSETDFKATEVQTETPIIDLEAGNDVSTANNNESEPSIIMNATCRDSDSVPALGSEVSVTTTNPVTPKITISFSSSNPGKNANLSVNKVKPKHQYPMYIPGAKVSPIKPLTSTRILSLPAKSTPPYKISLPPPNNAKEKTIFLNSKQIAEKPSENPIFLGKNKILLTTVKFPHNLNKFEAAKKRLRQQLKMPRGVQLVLLPDGTITYTVDPKVEVNESDIYILPAIIRAVQENMKSNMIVSQPNVLPSITNLSNEVVDLVDDDDDDDTPIVIENTNESQKFSEVTASSIQNNLLNNSAEAQTQNEQIASSKLTDQQTILEVSEKDTQMYNPTEALTVYEVPEKDKQMNSSTEALTVFEVPEKDIDMDNSTENQTINVVPGKDIVMDISTEYQTINEDLENHTAMDNSIEIQTIDQVSETGILNNPTGTQKENDQQTITEIPQTVQEIIHEESSTSGIQELSEPNRNTSIEENKSIPIEAGTSTVPVGSSTTKNILSDLMEMSGIFDEDITPTPQETIPVPDVQQVPDVQLVPDVQQALEVVTQESPTLRVMSGQEPKPQIPTPSLNTPISELSPVTSLIELKYACLHNGIFFKLDFETGYLIPINVSMKQLPKIKPTERTVVKSVIDLTSDDESNKQSTEIVQPPVVLFEDKPTSKPDMNKVKPVKLFKSVQPSILRLQRISDVKKTIQKKKLCDIMKRQKQKRKQLLQVTEQESLKIKSELPVKQYTKSIRIIINTESDEANKPSSLLSPGDDSSDEEPLSKKAKRKRETENAPMDREDVHMGREDVPMEREDLPMECEGASMDHEDAFMEREEGPMKQYNTEEELQKETTNAPVGEKHAMCSEFHYEIVLNQSENEGEDEPCILGF